MSFRQTISVSLIISLIIMTAITSCKKEKNLLYVSDQFSVYSDHVRQGEFEARVVASDRIISDYRNTASEHYSRQINYKFSINEKDNEARPGLNHSVTIGDEHEAPVVGFGTFSGQDENQTPGFLPANYKYTFRLDFRPVLRQFDEKGYYEAWDGSRIAMKDFKGVYIAGDARPLTWDFVNLSGNWLEMIDPDGDGIYEITLVLNPFDEGSEGVKEWKKTADLSSRPAYSSGQPIVDALFTMALEEMQSNIEPDSTFRTGAKWGGVWTRDVSYSTLLSLAVIEPEVAKISLMKKVKRGRIIQDTGSGGAWPVSSDRLTWALAAWEIYKYTGDRNWLETVFPIIRNSLDDDEHTIRSAATGMNHGESSFLDWREQTYPKWMNNADIYDSQNLGTNAVHYQANLICAQMAELLGEDSEKYEKRAGEIKDGINSFLWLEDRGYYGQYLYGRTYQICSPRFEALGEALCVLFGVAGEDRARSVVSRSPLTPFGATCIYPQIPGIPPYHNDAIWPFVQSFWNLAAARAGNEKALNHGLASIYRAAALFLTNYENMVAGTGDYYGTEINSDHMLWSMAGNMAMVIRVFTGMQFEPDGIRFSPVIPETYGGEHHLSAFRYRDAVLDITVSGFGNRISSFELDGEKLDSDFLPATLSGEHTVVIRLNNKSFATEGISLVANRFSPDSPLVTLDKSLLKWQGPEGAVNYRIYRNGEVWNELDDNSIRIEEGSFGEYMVTALDADGLESFASEPLQNTEAGVRQVIEMEDCTAASGFPAGNYSGKGFIRISPDENRKITVSFTVKKAGEYRMAIRYANGTGPWNTDNNCAIRTLYVNGLSAGVMVFPQRGSDEWSDWGWSNTGRIDLKEGYNELILSFEEWNTNMDGEINEALLDYLELVRL